MQVNTRTITEPLRILVVSVVLIVLVMSMVPQGIAYAEPRPVSGSLTIHKFSMEEMDNVGAPNDGNATTNIPSDAVPLANITFSIWQVNPSDAASVLSTTEAWPHVLTNTVKTGVTDAEGKLTFPDLAAGLYYVAETGSFGGNERVFTEPFLVSVPMKNVETGEWITDVHVYPKNQLLTIDKFVGEAGGVDYDFANSSAAKKRPVAIGESFGWSVFASLPANLSTANPESYTVSDDMNAHIDYSVGTLEVYSVPSMTTPVGSAYRLIEGVHYTQSYSTVAHTLSVRLTDEGMAFLGLRYTNEHDRFLLMKYDCVLNERAQNGVDLFSDSEVEYARNKAGKRVSAFTGDTTTLFANYSTNDNLFSSWFAAEGDGSDSIAVATVAMMPSVNTGQIEVTKFKDGTNEVLAGAEFGIAETAADALAGNFILTGTTNASGKLLFTGLKYGIPGDGAEENSDNTTFWLMETKAPEGYKLMEDPAEVVFSFQVDEAGEYHFARVSIYDVAESTSGYTSLFPETGDRVGQIIFGIVALGLACGIVAYAVSRRRKRIREHRVH